MEIAVNSPLSAAPALPRAYPWHMPTTTMASNTILARNLETLLLLLLINLAGVLAQDETKTINEQKQVLYIPFEEHASKMLKMNSIRFTSLPVSLAAPVFF